MSIDFSAERWKRVKENAGRWWAGELKRPLIQITVGGARPPDRQAPSLARVAREITSYDTSVTPEAIVDRWDYELSQCRFLGDAFPHVFLDFGAGVVAAFLGALPESGVNTVWFHPAREQEITDMRFRYDATNPWLHRVKDICRTAVERWRGMVQVGMTDLGGNLDVLSSFRPSERLLLDLYDYPEEVKRLTWEAHELWWRYFEEINAVLRTGNPGYTAWTPIFSETPYYMLQCDFCYMIGPPMFDEFVRPELAASCRRLDHAFYHLDGPGQLAHLDSLLAIPDLKGVQWVPGAGREAQLWPEVYRKIRRAGKLAQILGSFGAFDAIVEQVGSAEGLVFIKGVGLDREAEARQMLEKYGVPV